MKTSILTSLLLLAGFLGYGLASGISSIHVSQRTDGSGKVDIHFDLAAEGEAYVIDMEVRFHPDSNFLIVPRMHLSGDLDGIAPGNNKYVLWDGLASFPETHAPEAKLRIIATEGSAGDGSPCPGIPSFTDTRDGNTYNTVQIGGQCWTKENLKYLPFVHQPGHNYSWGVPVYLVYDYWGPDIQGAKATENYQNYGVLYNWQAAQSACPDGWQLPSDEDWTQLVNHLESQGYQNAEIQSGAGNALKSCRQDGSPLDGCNTTEHPRWNFSGYHGFDAFNFAALPGGYHDQTYIFGELGRSGGFWTSTEGHHGPFARRWSMLHNSGIAGTGYSHKTAGMSVRCIHGNLRSEHRPRQIIGHYKPFVFDTRTLSLVGTISNKATGDAVANANIYLTGQSSNHATISLADGSFIIEGVLPANYYLRVMKAGFQTNEDHIALSDFPEQSISVLLNPSDSNELPINQFLTAYADDIVEHPSNVFSLSGDVHINNLLFFDGSITVDKRPLYLYPRITGSCSFYATNIGQYATYQIKQSNVPFQFDAKGKTLIQSEWSTALESLYDIGGFQTTIGQIHIDPAGDFVEVKSVAVMPFPMDVVLGHLLKMYDIQNFIDKVGSSKILSRQNGVQVSVDIKNISVELGFVSLENLGLHFNTHTEVYGGSFTMNIPGNVGGNRTRWHDERDEFFRKLEGLPLELHDANGVIADSLSLAKLVDLHGERTARLLSVGAEIEFEKGSIDKIIITIGTRIPLGSTGLFLTQLTGGLENLASKNWKVIANVDIELGVEVPVLGSPVKLNNFGVEIEPWQVFRGSGGFVVFEQEVSNGFIEYHRGKNLLSASSTLNLANVIKGRNQLGLTGNRISGSGRMEVTTPPGKDLPWIPRLLGLGDIRLASALVSFNNTRIQSEVNTWLLDLALSLEFGKTEFPWFHFSLGQNLNSLHQIWKGSVDGKSAITFQVPENTRQLLVIASDTINPVQPFNFYLESPAGQTFDQDNAYHYITNEEEMSTTMSLLHPMKGNWDFFTDYPGDVALFTLSLDQKPSVMLNQPENKGSRSNEISLAINDYADTLNIQVYYNDNKRNFDGRLIDEFTVINNAELRFTWHNQDVPDGEYYIYTHVDDGKNAAVLQYAAGSIWVENDPGIEIPRNLDAVQQGDSVIVSWDEAQLANTVAATVYKKDLSTWHTRQIAVLDTNQTVLHDLDPGRGYEIWCRFINENGTYSQKSNVQEIVYASGNRNNPPFFTMDPEGMMVFVAGQMAQHALQATDADGDALTFSLLGDTLGMEVVGHMLKWTPTPEQTGVYYQGIVVSDGAETDTTYQQLVVYAPEQVEIRLAYNSVQLYEADNTFLILRNFFSEEPAQTVMLTNLRTGEEATVNCRRVNEFEYMGQFQLSFEKRSEIPVEDGDTIKATYTYDGNTYEALAFYNINQQPSDITPPGDITDLSIESPGDNKIVLYWTASGDDGYEGKAFRYDIRYAYEPIESEGVYLTAYLLQNAPYPSVAGEQDSLVVNLMGLQFIDQHDQVWFSIKAEDAAQNRSGLSNSPAVQTLLQPTNVTASVQDVYNIHLTWQGPQPGEKDGNAFESYAIFRQYNEGSYSMIASEIDALSHTDDLKLRPDGIYRYGIQSVYENGESEIAYSEPVSLQRFVNVNILCNLHGQQNHEGIQFEMTAHDEIYGQEFSRTTDATGLIMLANVFKSDYTVEIAKEGYVTHVEEIIITDSQFGFSFSLYCEPLPPADLAADDITAFSAMIDWTAVSTEFQWDILYGLEDFDPDSEGTLIENVIDNPYLLSGLSPETAYDVYVRAVCGENVSEWSDLITFTTPEHDMPNDLPLSGVVFDGDTECFDALQTITVSDFTVESGGSATLIAGESIHLLPGTIVEYGGHLLARIAQYANDYCGIPKAVEIAKEPVSSKEDDVVSSDFPHEVRENGFFKLYPNPTDGSFTLELTTAGSDQTIIVEVHSILGGRLFSRELPPQRMHTLSLEGHRPGMYIIRVHKGDKVGVERLIKRQTNY